MKRFKMLFTAVAILSVVTGALAFKGNAFTNHKLYCPDSSNNFCTIEVDGVQEQATGGTAVSPCGSGIAHGLTSNPSGACTRTQRVVSIANN